ncbi:MAG: hypothetical protein IT576_13365 [Verrucomicrobiales bacterium]|nr:hypothetical protein [Verrucomicrobiales bacterium]
MNLNDPNEPQDNESESQSVTGCNQIGFKHALHEVLSFLQARMNVDFDSTNAIDDLHRECRKAWFPDAPDGIPLNRLLADICEFSCPPDGPTIPQMRAFSQGIRELFVEVERLLGN